MSNTNQATIPVMFRGTSRTYKVLGVQGETIYGVNFSAAQDEDTKVNSFEIVFACLGIPPEGSPFTTRDKANFIVAMEEKPQGKLPTQSGCRLDKVAIKLGKKLTNYVAVGYVLENLPIFQKWLEETMEASGIVPAYNDIEDIFTFFFGKVEKDAEAYKIKMPAVMVAKPVVDTSEEVLPAIDFSKYGVNIPKTDTPETPDAPKAEGEQPKEEKGEDGEAAA